MDNSHLAVWLAIIAIASAVQTLLFVGAAIGGLRLYRDVTKSLAALNARLVPTIEGVDAAVEDLRDVMGRVRTADDQVRRAMTRTTQVAGHAAALLRSDLWPLVGLGRGVWAAVSAFKQRRTPSLSPLTVPGTARPRVTVD